MARVSGELSVGEASATMREIITRLHGSRGPYSLAFAFILVVCAGLGGIIWSSQQMLGIGAGALFVPQRSFQTKAQEQEFIRAALAHMSEAAHACSPGAVNFAK